MTDLKHPMQPIYLDAHGTPRFKPNKIIDYLQKRGAIDLNEIAIMASAGLFSDDDQIQLAQLIGYSIGGFGELSYVSDEAYEAANAEAARLVAESKK